MQKQISEQRIFTTLSQDSRQSCQLFSAKVQHVVNSKIRTKAADKTQELS